MFSARVQTARKCSYVFIHNDCQYTYRSTSVIGVFDRFDVALAAGWKTVLEATMKPWSIEFYKKRYSSNARGIQDYYIEDWDVATNTKQDTYVFNSGNRLDTFLKQNHATCETILQTWYDQIDTVNGTVPHELYTQEFKTT
jgi:hypothetical protein